MAAEKAHRLICPTCKVEVESFHKRSHVLPDWMYEKAYSAKHKLLQLDMNKTRADKKQSGIYGSYWCNQCEVDSNDGDTYASLVLTDKSPAAPERKAILKQELVAGVTPEGDTVKAEIWSGINFKRFQNFVFSVVMRGELFQRLDSRSFLEPRVLQGMATMYRDPRALDDETYPITVFKSPEGSNFREFSFPPCKGSAEELGQVVFRGAGYEFHVFTSLEQKPASLMTTRVKKDGTMPMVLQAFEKTGTFKNTKDKIKEIGAKFPPGKFGIKS